MLESGDRGIMTAFGRLLDAMQDPRIGIAGAHLGMWGGDGGEGCGEGGERSGAALNAWQSTTIPLWCPYGVLQTFHLCIDRSAWRVNPLQKRARAIKPTAEGTAGLSLLVEVSYDFKAPSNVID